MLSSDDRQALLTLARRVIEATARRESGSISRPGGSTILDEPRGAFVTLHEGGALRGCIGYVEPTEPLWQVVAHAAEAACTRDPRFAPDRRFAPPPRPTGPTGLAPRIVIRSPIGMALPLNRYVVDSRYAPPALLYQTLSAPPVFDIGRRRYGIEEVMRSERLRAWMPRIDLDTITFGFNSAYVPDAQLGRLDFLADAILRIINERPNEIFLLEGHTDAPGSEIYNLQLSEARALSVKYALVDAYGIPERNLVTAGYGEEFLKVLTEGPEQLNRRVTLRRITPLVSR